MQWCLSCAYLLYFLQFLPQNFVQYPNFSSLVTKVILPGLRDSTEHKGYKICHNLQWVISRPLCRAKCGQWKTVCSISLECIQYMHSPLSFFIIRARYCMNTLCPVMHCVIQNLISPCFLLILIFRRRLVFVSICP